MLPLILYLFVANRSVLMTSNLQCFSIGAAVKVDDKDTGYIIEKRHNEEGILVFTICYVTTRTKERNVHPDRCSPTAIGGTSLRSGTFRNVRHVTPPPPQQQQQTLQPTRTLFQQLQRAVKQCRHYISSNNDQNGSHPLYHFLKSNKNRPKGWMRNMLPEDLGEQNKNSSVHTKGL